MSLIDRLLLCGDSSLLHRYGYSFVRDQSAICGNGCGVQTPSMVISVAKSLIGVVPGDRCILYRDQCCFFRDGLSHHGDGYNSSLFCLPVSQTKEQDDEGQVLPHTRLLSAKLLKTVEGYRVDDEDAAIYSDAEDVNHFSPRREWSDKILKKKVAQSQAPKSDETIKSLL